MQSSLFLCLCFLSPRRMLGGSGGNREWAIQWKSLAHETTQGAAKWKAADVEPLANLTAFARKIADVALEMKQKVGDEELEMTWGVTKGGWTGTAIATEVAAARAGANTEFESHMTGARRSAYAAAKVSATAAKSTGKQTGATAAANEWLAAAAAWEAAAKDLMGGEESPDTNPMPSVDLKGFQRNPYVSTTTASATKTYFSFSGTNTATANVASPSAPIFPFGVTSTVMPGVASLSTTSKFSSFSNTRTAIPGVALPSTTSTFFSFGDAAPSSGFSFRTESTTVASVLGRKRAASKQIVKGDEEDSQEEEQPLQDQGRRSKKPRQFFKVDHDAWQRIADGEEVPSLFAPNFLNVINIPAVVLMGLSAAVGVPFCILCFRLGRWTKGSEPLLAIYR